MSRRPVKLYDTVFAVTDESDVNNVRLLGTAFNIGEGQYVTAGHVAELARASKNAYIRQYEPEGNVTGHGILDTYVMPDLDFGLLFAKDLQSYVPSWVTDLVALPADVETVGLAYGWDVKDKHFHMRFFKGHIVSALWTGSGEPVLEPVRQRPNPRYWELELSFPCPRGLSGAPLFLRTKYGLSVLGVIIGNTTSTMNVLTSVEEVESGGRFERHEVHEYLHLGRAISSYSLLDVPMLISPGDEDRPNTLREFLVTSAWISAGGARQSSSAKGKTKIGWRRKRKANKKRKQ